MKSNLRRLSLLTLAACAAVTFVRADEPPAGPPSSPPAGEHGSRPDFRKMRVNRMKMLDEKLQLTATQKDQVKALREKARDQVEALRDDESLSREDRRGKIGEIMKATHDQVRALLTPEQQKTFDAMPPEERGRRSPRSGGDDKPADVPPPARP